MIKLVDRSEADKVGNKLVFLPRFKKLCLLSFKMRNFTEIERRYCEQSSTPLINYAIIYAIKEAVKKAIRQTDEHVLIPLLKIEVRKSSSTGSWNVNLKKISTKLELSSITASKEEDYIWAIVLVRKKRVPFPSFQLLSNQGYY